MSADLLYKTLEGIAQGVAFQHSSEHAYLPQAIEQAHLFQPHAWVVAAMKAAYNRGRDDQHHDLERNQ